MPLKGWKWLIFLRASSTTSDASLTYNKVYSLISIIILVFVAGMVTIALEFTASRLLIPIFGSSIYTWGSLVGVILSGLSLGYYIGGRLADRKDADFIKFCSIIFSAGLYIYSLIYCSIIYWSFYLDYFIYNNSNDIR